MTSHPDDYICSNVYPAKDQKVPELPAWLTTKRLIEDTYSLGAKLPTDIDAIVGLARSGLIPGSILAVNRHVPLLSATEYGVLHLGGGWRAQHPPMRTGFKKMLVIDDTSCTGRALRLTLPAVRNVYPNAELLTAAVYCTGAQATVLNFYGKTLQLPHYLEWNFFNSGYVETAAFDFDGIFCQDILPQDDDDGERYVAALENAIPKWLPRQQPVPYIVTARMEKYRGVTMAWLQRYGVRVNNLIMGPWTTLAERRHPWGVADWKAKQYASLRARLFVESSAGQARVIAKATRRPVLCPEAETVFQ